LLSAPGKKARKGEAQDAEEKPQKKAGDGAEKNGWDESQWRPARIEAKDREGADQPEQKQLADHGSRSADDIEAIRAGNGSHFSLRDSSGVPPREFFRK
jgi:hypothetical protein